MNVIYLASFKTFLYQLPEDGTVVPKHAAYAVCAFNWFSTRKRKANKNENKVCNINLNI